jgi:hypothetical protein
MKAKTATAKRRGVKRPVRHKTAARRPARQVVLDKKAGTAADAESVTLLGEVARLYLAHIA